MTTIELAGEVDGADVGAVEYMSGAARRGDLDFVLLNILIDENKGAPEEGNDL